MTLKIAIFKGTVEDVAEQIVCRVAIEKGVRKEFMAAAHEAGKGQNSEAYTFSEYARYLLDVAEKAQRRT